jgi:hypothetical protein
VIFARLRRLFWTVAGFITPRPLLVQIVRRRARFLKSELEGVLTDKFVELLLFGMETAFLIVPSYRRNLRGFRGSYLFRTEDGRVMASASFDGGRMSVHTRAIAGPTVAVSFKDSAALRRFLFAQDQDIIASLLANDVEIDGNISYVYKFGFMARQLTLALGL